MTTQTDRQDDPSEDVVRELKAWLRTCTLGPGVTTPMRFLHLAYLAQGGRRSRRELASVIVLHCKGLRVEMAGGHKVVHGIAPNWPADELASFLRGENP